MALDVSIVIVNYHTSGQVWDCIASIRKFTSGINYEIIIVDNASEPGLKMQYEGYPDVKVILLDENVGFGRANNAGFKAARGRYLLCLNPDTLLLNNAIGILVKFMDSHPEAAACGANLFNSDMQPTLSFRRTLPGFGWELNELLNIKPEKKKYGSNRIFNNTGHPLEVGYITGADLMLRREVIEMLGGFDPRFFMYYEETDLCARIRKAGGKIFSVPEANIQHLEGGSFDTENGISLSRVERTECGRRVYYRIHFNWLYRQLLNAVYFTTLLSRSLLLPPCSRREGWRRRLRVFFRH